MLCAIRSFIIATIFFSAWRFGPLHGQSNNKAGWKRWHVNGDGRGRGPSVRWGRRGGGTMVREESWICSIGQSQVQPTPFNGKKRASHCLCIVVCMHVCRRPLQLAQLMHWICWAPHNEHRTTSNLWMCSIILLFRLWEANKRSENEVEDGAVCRETGEYVRRVL